MTQFDIDQTSATLERDGIVVLPNFLQGDALASIQDSFTRTLARPSFNTWSGYEMIEKWRVQIENLLMIDPHCYSDCALHPVVTEVVRRYVGEDAALVEARGWKTIRTKRNFHGWHGDAWFHPSAAALKPREIKLAIYLTDVTSGHFCYIAGSHHANRGAFPRHWSPRDVAPMMGMARDVKGPAGTAFLFDTSGVHRQTTPVLEPRDVMFFNYHDPAIPLQNEDAKAGRYQPIALNAGFLPETITPQDARMLGFGRALGRPAHEGVIGRPETVRYPWLHKAVAAALAARLEVQEANRMGREIRRAVLSRLRALPARFGVNTGGHAAPAAQA